MILEIAILNIVPGRETQFEDAFGEAKKLLVGVPGFLGLELERGIEMPSRFALLARWRSVEDHTVGFRGSATYEEWRKLLHPFFDGPPEVAHYRAIGEKQPTTGTRVR
jgi:heme-degrading monooxygenase HmoA